jgi:hypothetical protein
MSAADLVGWITGALDACGIPHMVVGSFASSIYGVPRSTQDLDVVIDPDPDSLRRFVSTIDPDRYYVDAAVANEALRHRGMFNVIDATTGWKIDLVIRKNTPHAREEMRRRVMGTVAGVLGVPAPLAAPEDIVIAKLSWARDGGSDRQLADVAGILAARGDQLDRAYLDRWIAELDLAPTWARAQALARD